MIIWSLLFAASVSAGPSGLAFYTPPSPLPAGKHGDVIWSRPLAEAAALPNAAENTLVLYHTTSAGGHDVAVSGTVAIPRGSPPRGGWPIVSWAHGTTGNAPQCAPSRNAGLNIEQRLMNQWIARGYAVAQTDYEGQGAPGVHPYYIEADAAHDVTDIVRAARQLYPDIGLRWIALGHSEGGSAALATAALGAAWAPELKLVGAISYAPGSHITLFLENMLHATAPVSELPLFGLMLQSYGTFDQAVHLERVLTADARARLPDLQSSCVSKLMEDSWWSTQVPAAMFVEHPDLEALVRDFAANEPSSMHPTVPVLLLQGTADRVVPAGSTWDLDNQLCHDGAAVTYDLFDGKNHGSIMPDSFDQALRWAVSAFSGSTPPSNCGSPPQTF